MELSNFNALSEFVEAVAASVAVVGLDDGKADRIITCNSKFREMLGMEQGEGPGNRLRDFVPRYARTEIESRIESCACAVAPVETVQPLDRNGQTRWWRIAAQPVLNGEGKPIATLLTCIEITDKIALENDLKVSNSRFSAVIQSAYDGIVSVDRDQRIKLFNSAAEEMFGYSAEDVIGKPLLMLIPEQYHENHDQNFEQFAGSPIQSRDMFERAKRINGVAKDGGKFPVEISIAKIDVNGSTEFTAVVRDISERARLIDQLRHQATVDLLTGLLNRRAFYMRASEQIALAQRNNTPVSVMMLDIDRFKLVNDNNGHAVGDMVLRILATAGESVLRKSDIFGRIGGEEFAVLLPETEKHKAVTLAERLRSVIENAQFDQDWAEYAPIPFTASIGVASVFEGEKEIDEALKRADEALYAAKQSGRNRVCAWSENSNENAPVKLHDSDNRQAAKR